MTQKPKSEIFIKIVSRLWVYRPYLILFLLMLLLTSITGFNGLYGQDSYEYLRYTNVLIKFAIHGIGPEKGYFPIGYSLLGSIFSAILKPVFALQLVSLISFVLAGIYIEKILKARYKEEMRITRFFVFLFFLLSPYPLRASITVMSDSLCLFFVTATCYYFLKYKEERNNIFFVLFAIFATAAIATRYAAFIVLLIPAICIFWYFIKNFSLKYFLIAGTSAILVLLPYIFIHKGSLLDFFHHEWLQGWSFRNFFRSSFDTADGHGVYAFPNILYCFFNLVHPAYCFVGGLFLVLRFKPLIRKSISTVQWIFITSWLLYAFFLAGIPFQNLRFLILSFPFVLVFFFPCYIYLHNLIKARGEHFITPLVLICIVVQLVFFVKVFIPFYHDNKIEKQISSEVIKHDTATLYTFSIDAAVSYYGFKSKIINMWEVKLDTLPSIRESALVLFNEKEFSGEWENKNPMLNWEYLKAKYQVIKIEDLPDNWELYAIKKPL